MHAASVLLFLAIVPFDAAIEDHVEVLHRNRVYDPITGQQRLDQIGGMRWDERDGEYHWQWWRSTEKVTLPYWDANRRCWVMSWFDEETQSFRRVYARSYQETDTLYDHEIRDRDDFPRSERRGLTPAPVIYTRHSITPP